MLLIVLCAACNHTSGEILNSSDYSRLWVFRDVISYHRGKYSKVQPRVSSLYLYCEDMNLGLSDF